MEIVYSDKDSALIEGKKEAIRQYEESLIFRIRHDGANWMSTEEELHRAFMEDAGRLALIKNLADLMACVITRKIVFNNQ